MTTYEMRESDQDMGRVAVFVEMFREMPEDVPAIVVIAGVIYDGHHRYLASQIAGVAPAVSSLTVAQCETLTAQGYDSLTIGAVAHFVSGHEDAIDGLQLQFGISFFEEALAGAQLLGLA